MFCSCDLWLQICWSFLSLFLTIVINCEASEPVAVWHVIAVAFTTLLVLSYCCSGKPPVQFLAAALGFSISELFVQFVPPGNTLGRRLSCQDLGL